MKAEEEEKHEKKTKKKREYQMMRNGDNFRYISHLLNINKNETRRTTNDEIFQREYE